MGRLLGLMLFCIGIGMVIGMLIAESVIIVIAAGLCLLCDIICFADKKFPTLLRGEFLSLSFMLFQLFRISDKKYIHTSF